MPSWFHCLKERGGIMSKMKLEENLDKYKWELLKAARRVGDRTMWGIVNGDLAWRGESANGNLIETEHPLDILGDVIAKVEKR